AQRRCGPATSRVRSPLRSHRTPADPAGNPTHLDPSVGSVGDAYDNALAESTIGLFKTELIKPHGTWRTCDQVEIATLEYVDWYNHRRLHSGAADLPPAAFEALYDPTEHRLTQPATQPI
ncbi:transposase, partial [Micromonospora sp. ATA32]|nr:transposase [Micromonospora sp. ATA32]